MLLQIFIYKVQIVIRGEIKIQLKHESPWNFERLRVEFGAAITTSNHDLSHASPQITSRPTG